MLLTKARRLWNCTNNDEIERKGERTLAQDCQGRCRSPRCHRWQDGVKAVGRPAAEHPYGRLVQPYSVGARDEPLCQPSDRRLIAESTAARSNPLNLCQSTLTPGH